MQELARDEVERKVEEQRRIEQEEGARLAKLNEDREALLLGLSQEEVAYVRHFVDGDRSRVELRVAEPAVCRLVQKGLIYRLDDHEFCGAAFYGLRPWARDMVKGWVVRYYVEQAGD